MIQDKLNQITADLAERQFEKAFADAEKILTELSCNDRAQLVYNIVLSLKHCDLCKIPEAIANAIYEMEHSLMFYYLKDQDIEEEIFMFENVDYFIIGSDSNCNVVIKNDNLLSKKHCLLDYSNGTDIYIYDLCSTNGVLVNSKKIENRTKLLIGDTIQIGSVRFVLKKL